MEGGRGHRAQFLRCGADGARSLTRLQSPPALSSARRTRTQSAGLHPASVSPGSQPHLFCCPGLPGVQCPARPPSPRESVPPRVQPRGQRAHRARRRAVRARATGAGTARLPAASPAAAARVRPARPPLGARSVGAQSERGRGWGPARAGRGLGGTPSPKGRGQAHRTAPRTYQSRPPAEGACWLDQRVPVSLSCWRLVKVPLPSPPGAAAGGRRMQVMHQSSTER